MRLILRKGWGIKEERGYYDTLLHTRNRQIDRCGYRACGIDSHENHPASWVGYSTPYPGIKSKTIKPRGIGSKLAREMEFKFGKEIGWTKIISQR